MIDWLIDFPHGMLPDSVCWAVEDSNWCTQRCCGPIPPFEMIIMNTNKKEIIHFNCPNRCWNCLCFCFIHPLKVTSPITGESLGCVVPEWNWIYTNYAIKNLNDEIVLRIEGPLFPSKCGDVEFKVSKLKNNIYQQQKITSMHFAGKWQEIFIRLTDRQFGREKSWKNIKKMEGFSAWIFPRYFQWSFLRNQFSNGVGCSH